jgi:hypothetical protein
MDDWGYGVYKSHWGEREVSFFTSFRAKLFGVDCPRIVNGSIILFCLFSKTSEDQGMELACVCTLSKTERDASNDLEFWAAFWIQTPNAKPL